VDRLTDTSLYTGTHKERFDEHGKGRGGEGRDSTSKGKGTVGGLISSQPAYVSGYKGEGTYGENFKKGSLGSDSPTCQPLKLCHG